MTPEQRQRAYVRQRMVEPDWKGGVPPLQAEIVALRAALDDPDVQRFIEQLAENRRKRGAYWLTPEGRAEIRETWADTPNEIAPVLLAALDAAEQAVDRHEDEARAKLAEYRAEIERQAERADQAEQERDAALHEVRLGHLRLDDTPTREVAGPLYERISVLIERLVHEKSEIQHMLAATGHEKDELRARASAAEHRRSAAEYRATRIELDRELRQRADQAEAKLIALTAPPDPRAEWGERETLAAVLDVLATEGVDEMKAWAQSRLRHHALRAEGEGGR